MLSRKKLGIALIGLIIVAVLYYFSVGSTQITAELKKQMNSELTSLKSEGFGVNEREIKESQEHFIISFDNPEKIAHFFTRQGLQLGLDDARLLTGLKVAVDVHYMTDDYSGVAFEMYPIALPTALTDATLNEQDKKALAQVQKMIEKKTFLMHIAINKLGTGFKGYMKDIEETLQGEKEVKISMNGFTFSGEIEDDKIYNVKQNLKQFLMYVPNELEMKFTDLESDYRITGKTIYDYSTNYSLAKMLITNKSTFDLMIDEIGIHSTSTVKNGLASGSMTTKTKDIKIVAEGKKFAFETFIFDINANNLDISAFERLQKIDLNNEKEMNTLIQELISKGININIPALSIAKVESEGKKMDGFDLNAKVDIDKSLNITALQTNPMAALSAIDANLNISLSKELFAIVAGQPQAMMALMLFQPKELNGKKVYEVELKKGSLNVNGQPML